MATLIPLLVIVFAVLAAVPMLRHHDPERRAQGLRRSGFGWLATFGGLGGLFVAGETFADPGGWAAVGLVLAWVVPLALLSVLAWRRPALAQPVLLALVVVVVAYCAWSVLGPQAYRDFRNQRGPIDAIAVLVVSVALGVLGVRRARPAGLMLLATSLLPMALMALGSGAPFSQAFSGSLGAASVPGLVSAALFLLAAHEAQSHAASTPHGLVTPRG